MTAKCVERLGWLGFMLIISAYFFVTVSAFEVSSSLYHLLNLAGALCMAANASHNKAKPLFWLNIAWSFIAAVGLIRIATGLA
jgi:thiol:disulfide interchange protein